MPCFFKEIKHIALRMSSYILYFEKEGKTQRIFLGRDDELPFEKAVKKAENLSARGKIPVNDKWYITLSDEVVFGNKPLKPGELNYRKTIEDKLDKVNA